GVPVLGGGPVGEGGPADMWVAAPQRRDVNPWAGVFQPRGQRVHLPGRRLRDVHGAAEQAGDDSGGLLGGELVGGDLDALAEHGAAGVQDGGGGSQDSGGGAPL